jgi:hypothetical protein
MLRIFASAHFFIELRLLRCAPNPSNISIVHHCKLSHITGKLRYSSTRDGAISSHASSFMYAFSIMMTVDPTAQPSCFRNVSLYQTLCFLPFRRKTVGPLGLEATPVWYSDGTSVIQDLFSCYFFPCYPTILNSLSASAIKFVSLPPRMKWLMSSPNDFPVALNSLVFFVRRKQSAFSYNSNHQHYCATVHWLRFDVVF